MLLTVAVLTALPGALVGVVLSAAGLPAAVCWTPPLALALYCASFFTHELGHAVAATVVGRGLGVDPALAPRGGFLAASMVGPSLGPLGDATVSLAGPALGMLPALALLVPGGPFVVSTPFVLLFLTHLIELRPSRSDGAALAVAVALRKESNARRDRHL